MKSDLRDFNGARCWHDGNWASRNKNRIESDKRPMRDLFEVYFMYAQFDLLTYAFQPYDVINLSPCCCSMHVCSWYAQRRQSRVWGQPENLSNFVVVEKCRRTPLPTCLWWVAAARKKSEREGKELWNSFLRDTQHRALNSRLSFFLRSKRRILYPQIWATTTTSGSGAKAYKITVKCQNTHMLKIYLRMTMAQATTAYMAKKRKKKCEVNSMLLGALATRQKWMKKKCIKMLQKKGFCYFFYWNIFYFPQTLDGLYIYDLFINALGMFTDCFVFFS